MIFVSVNQKQIVWVNPVVILYSMSYLGRPKYVIAFAWLKKIRNKAKEAITPHDNCFSTIRKIAQQENKTQVLYEEKNNRNKDNLLPTAGFQWVY